MEKTGQRIKKKRIELGLTVEELAKRLGKNRATVYRYENNDIERLPANVLYDLAKALHTTQAYLMGWDDNISEEDKDIIDNLLKNDRFNEHSYSSMESDKEALKILLNTFGYDLKLDNNGYTLFGDCGVSDVTEEEINTLLSSTKVYLEFNAKKLLNEKCGWKDGKLSIKVNNNNE